MLIPVHIQSNTVPLQAFEGTECQWPLFFSYSFITGMVSCVYMDITMIDYTVFVAIFRGETERAENYWRKLSNSLQVSPLGNIQ